MAAGVYVKDFATVLVYKLVDEDVVEEEAKKVFELVDEMVVEVYVNVLV
jgi:hypothetical protein